MDWKKEIEDAASRLAGKVFRTPLLHSIPLSNMTGGEVYLKLESEQVTGSFKARGALNRIVQEDSRQHFVTASTGNHAQGFARALNMVGAKGIIYVPEKASPSKVKALESYGVEIRKFGKGPIESELKAKSVAESEGAVWVSPYNDTQVIAGQGTIAKEISEDLPDVDSVIGCIGGGGMMSGIGLWLKSFNPEIRVIGALPELSPEMYLSVQKGEIVVIEDGPQTLSDGSAGGLEPGSQTFDHCKETVDEYTLVTEKEIAEGIKWMAHTHHKMIEGAASVALMTLKNHVERFKGQKVVIIICGANIDPDLYAAILTGNYH